MRQVALVLATVGLIAVGMTATQARAHDGWWGYPEWREHAWREHEWRYNAPPTGVTFGSEFR